MSLESRPVRLSEIIQRSMHLTVPRAEEKGLAFNLDCAPDLPEGILSDATRLTQVLVNLLGNAIKFT
ncbi:hybrid sensor histidine kinase/response regulator, partial [bacterium]|nr:hybrid sensor histidine kinase/response regulator [bacterium]